MKIHNWLFILTLLWLLTGCAGVTGQEETAKLEPINPAEWPTPQPQAVAASPTPFPKVIRKPAATPTPPALPTAETAAPAEATTDNTNAARSGQPEVSPEAAMAETAAPAAAQIGAQLPLVAVGFTTAEIAMRQGPGANYGAATLKTSGDLLGILGTNGGGDWVYTVDTSLNQGWLPLNALRLVGSLTDAPVLPPNPLALLLAAVSGAAETAAAAPTLPAAAGSTAETVVEPPLPATPPVASPAAPSAPAQAALKAVATAQINSYALNMRQGPGSRFDKVATLSAKDQLSILGLSPDKAWALVETAKGRGWVSLSFLTVTGSLDNAPLITPEQTALTPSPAPEPAAATIPVNEANAPAAPVVNVSDVSPTTPTSPYPDLTPIATARLSGASVDIRPGPGTQYAPIDQVTQTDAAIVVLGQDSTGQWVLVQPDSVQLGWAALADLQLDGSVAAAPQLTTAWVESNGIETRSGPALYHEVIGSLSMRTLVSVLGTDKTRSWLLVKPLPGGNAGWTPANFLTVAAPLKQVPVTADLLQPPPVAVQAAAAPITPPRPLNQSKMLIQTASGGEIMVINPDGTGLRRLTTGIDPVLAPDGQTVAFTRWQGETGALWLINIDGSNEREIMGDLKQAKGAEWSPDGSQIVLNFQQGGRLESKTQCFKLSNGDPPFPPRNATNFQIKFGKDGPMFCWDVPPDPHWGLRLINLADGSYKDVDGGTYAFRPAWDPTRAWRIVSDGGRGLLELDVNRDYRQMITDEINDGSPVFSPDGRYLLVTLGQPGGGPGYDIFRLNADGSGRVRLTETPLWETALPEGAKLWNNVAPTWSPDGQQVIFLTDRTGRWEIWAMHADGTNPQPFFSDKVAEQLQLSYNFVDERSLNWR